MDVPYCLVSSVGFLFGGVLKLTGSVPLADDEESWKHGGPS